MNLCFMRGFGFILSLDTGDDYLVKAFFPDLSQGKY